jgi:hypothetical protein
MGVRFPSVASNTFVGPLPASAVETVVLTTPPISEPVDNAQILLFWFFVYAAGTGNTSALFHLRRGTTTAGASVGVANWPFPAVAAAVAGYSGWYFDFPGVVSGQQYSLTLVQTGASAAGTFNDGVLIAMVL